MAGTRMDDILQLPFEGYIGYKVTRRKDGVTCNQARMIVKQGLFPTAILKSGISEW